jgi:hypothetical protein
MFGFHVRTNASRPFRLRAVPFVRNGLQSQSSAGGYPSRELGNARVDHVE